jgi:hypothetical protein
MINLYKYDIYILRNPQRFRALFGNPSTFKNGAYILTKEEFVQWVVTYPTQYHRYIETSNQISTVELEDIGPIKLLKSEIKHTLPENQTLLVTDQLRKSLFDLPNKMYVAGTSYCITVVVGNLKYSCLYALYEYSTMRVTSDENSNKFAEKMVANNTTFLDKVSDLVDTKMYHLPDFWPRDQKQRWTTLVNELGHKPALVSIGISYETIVAICKITKENPYDKLVEIASHWHNRLLKGDIRGLTIYSPPNETTVKRFLLDNPNISVKYD